MAAKDRPVSLQPLTPEEALRDLLAISPQDAAEVRAGSAEKPRKKPAKGKAKKRKKRA